MLTFIPSPEGYFRTKLEVVKLAVASLIAHTPAGIDILIFDNGSCLELVDHLKKLRDEGSIDYLLLSAANIGKIAAVRMIFSVAPGDWVAYADDDIFFYPGWLEAQTAIFDAFGQRAGMVSGVPVRNANTYARQSLDRLIADPEGTAIGVSIRREIPDDWEQDWARSTGRDPESHLREQAGRQDVVLETKGIRSIGGANHFQFLSRKNEFQKFLPVDWSGKLMGQMVEIDENVDRHGLLRLSTTGRYTRHMGNVLEGDLRQAAQDFGLQIGRARRPTARGKHWLLYLPGMGRLFRWVYDRLFTILHEN